MLTGSVKNTRGERGQILIFMMMAMTVVFLIGFVAVDIGLWFSERRGAQTDADFAALSGAWELLDPGATEASAAVAVNAALDANDEQLNASVAGLQVDLVARCVSVDVRHDSKPLFLAIFGLASLTPDIGAHAKACTGAANVPGDLVPIQINEAGDCFTETQEPEFTSMCPIEMAAQGGEPRGMLDLQAPEDYCSYSPGAGDIENLLENGAGGMCFINETGYCDPTSNGPWYDCVAIQDGNPKKVIDGVYARLSTDGDCDDLPDSNGDGIDDFFETVYMVIDNGDPYTSIYEARDCDQFTDGIQKSPRIVTLIVLKYGPDAGNAGYPIIAFAAFYIAGCAHEWDVVVDENDLDRYCGPDFPEPGHAVVYGRFVNLIVAGFGISDATDQTTLFGIALVE